MKARDEDEFDFYGGRELMRRGERDRDRRMRDEGGCYG